MKTKFIFLLLSLFVLLSSCNKDLPKPAHLEGEWVMEYQIMPDGTKDYNPVYALLEFDYSDGFALYDDHVAYKIIGGSVNTSEQYKWKVKKNILTFTVEYTDGSIKEFDFTISEFNKSNMFIESPKGRNYYMIKK